MSNKSASKRRKHSPLIKKAAKNSKLVQLIDYINDQILAQSASDTADMGGNGDIERAPELAKAWFDALNGKSVDPEQFRNKDFVDWFMTKGGNEPRRRYQAEVVNQFCHASELQELQSNSCNISSRKACLVDDRTSDGTTSKALGHRKQASGSLRNVC
ncbi:hypothetical protein FCOIX_10716 [Fusarium coicis]|nr:hypothetical protein FCOIX_10716 [Fusarium coicis]